MFKHFVIINSKHFFESEMLFSLDIIIFRFFFMDRVSIVNLFYPRYIFNPRKMVLVVNSYSISIFLLIFTLFFYIWVLCTALKRWRWFHNFYIYLYPFSTCFFVYIYFRRVIINEVRDYSQLYFYRFSFKIIYLNF